MDPNEGALVGEEQCVCSPMAGRRAWIIREGYRWALPIRQMVLNPMEERCQRPTLSALGNVLFGFERQPGKVQHNLCPPQGSSVLWRYLRHIDPLSVAKPLDKDIPYFA